MLTQINLKITTKPYLDFQKVALEAEQYNVKLEWVMSHEIWLETISSNLSVTPSLPI